MATFTLRICLSSSSLEEKPNDPVVLHNLGVALTEEARYKEAEEKFLQAWEFQKEAKKAPVGPLSGRCRALFGLGRRRFRGVSQAFRPRV